jgi:predicted aspartyl protease
MSAVEATFMLKNDYLSPNDISGKQRYMTADGELSEGTVINLRKVDFGGLTLSNIKASVTKNQNAPLLLGQSVLNRLGKIEIDNDKRVIKVTYKEFANSKSIQR